MISQLAVRGFNIDFANAMALKHLSGGLRAGYSLAGLYFEYLAKVDFVKIVANAANKKPGATNTK